MHEIRCCLLERNAVWFSLRHHCEQNHLQERERERERENEKQETEISKRVRYFSVLYGFLKILQIRRTKKKKRDIEGIRDSFFFFFSLSFSKNHVKSLLNACSATERRMIVSRERVLDERVSRSMENEARKTFQSICLATQLSNSCVIVFSRRSSNDPAPRRIVLKKRIVIPRAESFYVYVCVYVCVCICGRVR